MADQDHSVDRPRYWYRGPNLRISEHALLRARERLSSKFSGVTLGIVGKMCAGAVYKFKGQPQVLLPERGDAKEDRQVALPFVDQMTQQIVGYLILHRDRLFPNDVVCKTFLAPDHWQLRTGLRAALPEWYTLFCQRQVDRERRSMPRH